MLTPKQAAAKLGVSQSLIYGVLQSGRLAGLRVGCRGKGRWLIEETDFAAFIESCKASAGAVSDGGELVYLKESRP